MEKIFNPFSSEYVKVKRLKAGFLAYLRNIKTYPLENPIPFTFSILNYSNKLPDW